MDENPFKNMTKDEIVNAVLSAIADINESDYKYGEITITISGGRVKHINVLKPWNIHSK